MRKLITFCTLCILAATAHADSLSGMVYVGGTLTAPASSAPISLVLSDPDALVLHSGTSTVTIPWKDITDWQCYRQNTHRLGVLPTIAAGLVAARQHTHYFSLTWNDGDHHTQAILIQVPPQFPRTIHVVLEAHAPRKTHNTVPQNSVPE